MGKAIKSAFDSLDPGVLLMLKLSYLHGVSQAVIARMWQCDQTRVSRSLTSAREQIASQTMQFINESDAGLELEWEDFQKLCAAGLDLIGNSPSILSKPPQKFNWPSPRLRGSARKNKAGRTENRDLR